MSTHDISRTVFDPRKQYSSVRMQQGRVIVDDDWNENERIENEERRLTRADVIGSHGTSDGGFRIGDPTFAGGAVDFSIGPGSFYLGGLRFEAAGEETYCTQVDWLQQSGEEKTQVPEGERTDLVYLEGWEQSVTSVEDSELLEAALGGADTSGRMRVMRRIRIEPGIGSRDCADAWQEATTRWQADGIVVDDGTQEVRSRSTLTVTLSEDGEPTDLCSPSVVGGYLGAENQAIRVQLRRDARFIWGFDNASPLFRVLLDADRKTLRLLTEPKDQAHWPGTRHIVEVLPWSAVLPNGEKLAALEGHASSLEQSYDPAAGTIKLRDPVPVDFGGAWTSRPDSGALAAPSRSDPENKNALYYYMRVWDRGSEAAAEEAELDFSPGIPRELPGTGVSVVLAGDLLLPGDYWVVALRPETRTTVVPWSLEGGRLPHGIRRFRCPLGLIHWRKSGPAVVGEAHDCRRRFRPLNEINSCCTYTVGDGRHSHGDFASIQAAINALPPEGGEICVLQGEYREVVEIRDRRNVRVHGCGARSVLRETAPDFEAVLAISNSQHVSIDSMSIVAERCICVAAVEEFDLTSKRPVPLTDIALTGLKLSARDSSAIAIDGGSGIRISNNSISIAALSAEIGVGTDAVHGKAPALIVGADEVLIEGNDIQASAFGVRKTALGGIQIWGGSREVEIRRNRIHGGNGNGITLGNVVYVPEKLAKEAEKDYAKLKGWLTSLFALRDLVAWLNDFVLTPDDCLEKPDDPQPGNGPDGTPLVPMPGAPVRSVRILDNLIEGMGGDGIGVPAFFDLEKHQEVITVAVLEIGANRIQGCYRWGRPQPSPSMLAEVGHGGIALADVEHATIRGNEIVGNGSNHERPTCGVFILHSEGVIVESNWISANGRSVAALGNQGGVIVCNVSPDPLSYAAMPSMSLPVDFHLLHASTSLRMARLAATTLRPTTSEPPDSAAADDSRTELGVMSGPAARIHGNVVIAPVGLALKLVGEGDFLIEGNQFISQSPGAQLSDLRELAAHIEKATAAEIGLKDLNFPACAVLVINGGAGASRQDMTNGVKV